MRWLDESEALGPGFRRDDEGEVFQIIVVVIS